MWVLHPVSHVKERTQIYGVWEKNAYEIIWTQ
jgi:hypothetical protein